MVKNVGNIVPPSTVSGDTNSTAAAIEFAVQVLRVSDIVVCGHSQCGAVAALMADGAPTARSCRNFPAGWTWLRRCGMSSRKNTRI